eukprot:scaffold19957_cov118-Isochrysis_galbana.AAC.4
MFITTASGPEADRDLAILNDKFSMTCTPARSCTYFLGMNIHYNHLREAGRHQTVLGDLPDSLLRHEGCRQPLPTPMKHHFIISSPACLPT